MRGIINIVGTALLWLVLCFVTMGIGIIFLVAYLLAVFFGGKKRVAKLQQKLRSTMMRDETVVHEAVEFRPYALMHRREGIAVTSSRIISVRRKILGGFRMRDQQWKDLRDVTMDENILPGVFGSAMRFEFHREAGAEPISVDGIDSRTASEIYAYAQAQEHAWEEKLRVRDLEEKRALAGGVNIHSSPGGMPAYPTHDQPRFGSDRMIEASPASGGSMDTAAAEINRAKRLMESGAISDAEFQELKSKILGKCF